MAQTLISAELFLFLNIFFVDFQGDEQLLPRVFRITDDRKRREKLSVWIQIEKKLYFETVQVKRSKRKNYTRQARMKITTISLIQLRNNIFPQHKPES